MSTGKKLLNYLYGKRCTLVLSVLFVFVLFAVFASNSTNGSSALSQRDMENIFGGLDECKNCDNCTGMSGTMIECYHLAEAEPIVCYDNGCIWNVLDTASCQPNQGEDANGCDTTEPTPPTTSIQQHTHFVDMSNWCPTALNESDWQEIYYGCDTSNGYSCTKTHAATKACELENWMGCPGLHSHTRPRGTKYVCGCE